MSIKYNQLNMLRMFLTSMYREIKLKMLSTLLKFLKSSRLFLCQKQIFIFLVNAGTHDDRIIMF